MTLNSFVLILGFITTIMDPSDPVVKWERICMYTNHPFPIDEYDLFCTFCDCHVMERTKHCGKCKRCTMEFDHHCLYLNNCIGSRNYKYFFSLIVIVLVQALAHLIFIVFFGYTLYLTPFEEELEMIHNYSAVALLAGLVINFHSFLFTFYLVIYHLWLILNQKSTYQHILEKRELKNESTRSLIISKSEKTKENQEDE